MGTQADVDSAQGRAGHARTLAERLREALSGAPVVILGGARQVGKSTLAQDPSIGGGRRYLTLDHLPTLDRALRAPEALVAAGGRLTIDEVQRAPDLMIAVKHVVDRVKQDGQFLLTGSANLLLARTSGESLAGRARYLTLHPFTPRELRREPGSAPWGGALLSAPDAESAAGLLATTPSASPRAFDWRGHALRGGFPPAALAARDTDRIQWFEDYATTYLRRDLRELAQVDDLAGFGRLLRLAALRTGGLLNQSELGRDAGLARSTTMRWMSLIEASYLASLVPPWHSTRSKRLVRAPKLYPTDTGLALHLAGVHDADGLESLPRPGVWLEALVRNDLASWAETATPRPGLYHYRTSSGAEIDFLLEQGRRVLPIEVKSNASLRTEEGRAIEAFCDEHGRQAPFGLVLHDGDELLPLTNRVLGVPLCSVL